MTFGDYQKRSRKTAVYPDQDRNFVYPTIGLAGETGEIANKIKKILRQDWELTAEIKQELAKEIGDALWYIAQLCTELGLSLDKIAKNNLEKSLERYSKNKIHGSGDNR